MGLLMRMVRKIQAYVGMRMIKTVVAVAFCFFIYELRGRQGMPFYSALAAIYCIRPDLDNSKTMARQQIAGTALGAAFGLGVLLFESCFLPELDEVAGYLLATVMLIPVILTTVVLKKKDISYFTCAVYLGITILPLSGTSPQAFMWNRFFDTIVGIILAMLVNMARLPYRKNEDVLFVSGLDEVLLGGRGMVSGSGTISDYGRRELNRMLGEGMHFTVATMRSPVGLIAPLKEIDLKLPIIAMDGAVLYSIKDNSFLKVFPMKRPVVNELACYLEGQGLRFFVNSILQDTLFIYYDTIQNDVERQLFQHMKTSPYHNFLKGYPGEDEDIVYLTLLLEEPVARHLNLGLVDTAFAASIRWHCYPSLEYPGFYYINIYDIDSSREKMINYLKGQLGVSSSIAFGSIPQRYDVYTGVMDADEAVRMLRKYYEPAVLPWLRKG